MASMFLSSSKTCRQLPSSLSEKSRWWPVMHRVPLLGGWSGCRSTTSSTLAVLICSDSSITNPSKITLRCWTSLCTSGQITCEKTKAPSSPHCWVGSTAVVFCLFDDKESINRYFCLLSITRHYCCCTFPHTAHWALETKMCWLRRHKAEVHVSWETAALRCVTYGW